MTSMIQRVQNERTPGVWDPFRLMREMLSWSPLASMVPGTAGGFSPSFEVRETEQAYLFTADVPGVKEEDLEVTVTGNRLTITGRREAEQVQQHDRWYAFERTFGSFSRTFTLPDGADLERVAGDLDNGVLTVSVPKRAESRTRKISLKGIADKVRGVLGARRGAA